MILMALCILPAVAFGDIMATPSQPGAAQPLDLDFSKPIPLAIGEKLKAAQLPFIRNQGQISNHQIHYYVDTPAGSVWITRDAIVYGFQKTDTTMADKEKYNNIQGWILRETPKGFTPETETFPKGIDPSPTAVSYFRGKSHEWRRQVPAFNGVTFGRVFDGIDLYLKISHNQVEKIFTVAPGANPRAIAMVVDGADGLAVNAAGELEIQTGIGLMKMTVPLAFQEIDGKKTPVTVAYRLGPDQHTYGFTVGDYQKDRPLLIDPMLTSTYIGSQNDDYIMRLARDASGNVFVAGRIDLGPYSWDDDFPITSGAYQKTAIRWEVVVCKFNPDLSKLLAATFLGSNADDYGHAIAVDAAGNVFVAGHATGNDFPVTQGAYEANGQDYVGFVSKLDNSLSSLLASTVFTTANGYNYTSFDCMTLDAAGNVIAAGKSCGQWGDVFPPDAYDVEVDGRCDGVIVKFDNNLTTMLAGTALGGSENDGINAIALDSAGNIFVAGAPGADFPATAGSYLPAYPGSSYAVFVAKLNPGMTDLMAATFYGGEDSNYGTYVTDMVIDGSDNVFITGETQSGLLPVTAHAADTTFNGGWRDAYIAKFNNNLSTLFAGTYLGGSNHDSANAIALDSAGNVYVGGSTTSGNFPVTVGADDTTYERPDYDNRFDAFVGKLDNRLQSVLYATFVGGARNEYIRDMLVDDASNIWVTGYSAGDFPVTPGAYDTTHSRLNDGFVSKMSVPKVLAVDVIGPRMVSPGGEATYVLKYRNNLEIIAEDVVLTASLPVQGSYASSSHDGIIYSEKEIFWRLGNLDPQEQGEVSMTVKIAWGTTSSYDVLARIDCTNEPMGTIEDIIDYLGYEYKEVANTHFLNSSEIDALLSTSPRYKAFYEDALRMGFQDSKAALMATLTDGDTLLRHAFLKRDPFEALEIRRYTFAGSGAEEFILMRQNESNELIYFDETGGMTINLNDETTYFWGSWVDPSSGPVAEQRTSTDTLGTRAADCGKCTFRRCVASCRGQNLLEAAKHGAVDVSVIVVTGPFGTVGNVLRGLYSVFKVGRAGTIYAASGGQAAAQNLAEDVIGDGIPVLGFLKKATWNVYYCKNYCKATENDCYSAYCCSKDAVKCSKKISFGKYRLKCETKTGVWRNMETAEGCPVGDECFQKDSWTTGCKKSCSSVGTKNPSCSTTTTQISPAHDPNAKSVDFEGHVLPGQTLTYTVEYENTGSGTAYDVFILDVLDENLDASTLSINNGGDYAATARLLSWDIGELPPCTESSPDICKGDVTFSVKVKNELASGTEITNFAKVYFPSADEITPTNPVVNMVNTITSDPKSAQTLSGSPVAIRLSGRDTGSASLTYRTTADPLYGTLSGTPPNVTYTSMEQFSGMDEFYYVVNNGLVDSSPARVAVTVEPNAADKTAPTIAETWPQNGATSIRTSDTPVVDGVRYLPTLTARFSEPMKGSTITNTAFTVAGVAGEVYYDASTWTAYFYPSQALNGSTTYTATISTAVEDLNGNKPADAHTWSFTTDSLDKQITTTASPTAAGIVTGSGTYTEGATVTVSATANTGWFFVSWTEGDLFLSTNSSYTFTAGESRTLVANFNELPRVAVTANPSDAGTVTGGGAYTKGQSVTLSASANAGWVFVNWTESDVIVSTNSSYTFAAEKNRTLVANFRRPYYVSKIAGCDGNSPCYSAIQAALDAADDGEVILVGKGNYDEAPVKNAEGTVTIRGGWNDAFTTQTPGTTLVRAPAAPKGTVVLNEIVITP